MNSKNHLPKLVTKTFILWLNLWCPCLWIYITGLVESKVLIYLRTSKDYFLQQIFRERTSKKKKESKWIPFPWIFYLCKPDGSISVLWLASFQLGALLNFIYRLPTYKDNASVEMFGKNKISVKCKLFSKFVRMNQYR